MTRLEPPVLRALSLGDVRPAGWLRGQLELQAAGMAGHLDEFWPDVADSAWIGGAAEGWERAPYWLDALIPLAVLLDDPRLLSKVDRWISGLLERQDADGWMGLRNPESTPHGPYDVWPRMVLLKVFLQHYAHFGEDRVLQAALRLSRRIDAVLADWPLHEWGRVRWADLVLSWDRLYEITGEEWLLDAADRVRKQSYDWAEYAAQFPYREKVTDERLHEFEGEADDTWMNDRYLSSHGVNVAMGLKAFPVWGRRGEPQWQHAAFDQLLARLDEFHGQATGVFTADEHLAGTSPAQGTETCAVVEFLFSLAIALQAWGPTESIVARWERIAFNALPASARADECGHQYDQQANQAICHVTEDRVYTNNGPDANIFGLEPHFGCCTANRHQGWPKFAAHLWMRTVDEGLIALSYAPCRLETVVNGQSVRIVVSGDYPFTDQVRISVEGGGAFPLQLRIPGWSDGATVTVDGSTVQPAEVVVLHRDWSGRHDITLDLPASLKFEHRTNDAVSVSRGPLVFALAVDEEWRRVGGTEPYADWEVHPGSAWNLSLALDPALRLERRPVGELPYSPDGAPIRLHGKASAVPQWTLEHGAADVPPPSPCPGEGPERDIVLLPYGAARLRVTEMPWHDAQKGSGTS